MDPISLAASLIAIGQGIAAIPKIVEALRSSMHLSGELASLMNELSTLQALQLEVQTNAALLGQTGNLEQINTPESPLLQSARKSLKELILELNSLLDKCRKASKDGKVTPKRLKFFWYSKKLSQLSDASRVIRQDIQSAMISMSLLSHHGQGRLLLEIRAITTSAVQETREGVTELRRLITAEQSADNGITTDSPGLEDTPSEPGTDNVAGTTSVDSDSTVTPSNGSDSFPSPQTPSTSEYVEVQTSLRLPIRCKSKCTCQCHRGHTNYSSPGWLKPILGSVFLDYGSLPVPQRWKCDQSDCSGSGSSVQFSYNFPVWMLKRRLFIALSVGSAFGTGASLHLDIPRVFPLQENHLWEAIQLGQPRRVNALFHSKHKYLPSDVNMYDTTLLAHSIDWDQYHITRFLVEQWNLLEHRGRIDRHSVVRARRRIFSLSTLSDADAYLIRQIASLETEEEDSLEVELRKAITDGSDILPALEENPLLLESVGFDQVTPLALSCWCGNLDATLKLIAKGANLNSQDYEGTTPLMAALQCDNFSCATALLRAGCDRNMKTNDGHTALFYALGGGPEESFEIIKALIHGGDLQFYHPEDASTPIHWLCSVRGPERLVEECLNLLVNAGCDINRRNSNDSSPLFWAAITENDMILRLLIKAEARLDFVDKLGGNILHNVAAHGTKNVLKTLNGLELDGINVDAVNCSGKTPVDTMWWRIYCSEVFFNVKSRPTKEEIDLFESLVQKVRDRALKADINDLEQILVTVSGKDGSVAMEETDRMRNKMETLGREEDAETLRVMSLQIRDEMWSAAQETAEEMIEVRQERISRSPFDDYYNWYADPSWEGYNHQAYLDEVARRRAPPRFDDFEESSVEASDSEEYDPGESD
ncbi:hypothetical protein B0T10DRAFT_55492 [Thelonectria olida]|uniref:Fungal N-terminal domain-containing protein n=1 Tax=Thelonectria olida TaxID=1576542 RepID=A0A9P8W3I3_9HYPO|nr:hypothetical protein B0T10DRAFT_55492 [Thelonectria olida]